MLYFVVDACLHRTGLIYHIHALRHIRLFLPLDFGCFIYRCIQTRPM